MALPYFQYRTPPVLQFGNQRRVLFKTVVAGFVTRAHLQADLARFAAIRIKEGPDAVMNDVNELDLVLWTCIGTGPTAQTETPFRNLLYID
jgi:hypothetical protein